MPSYQRSKSYNWAYSNGRLFLRQRSNFDKIHDASSSKFDDSEESVDGETVTVSFDNTTYSNASIVRQGVDGSLQMMTKLPVDVLYEVCARLVLLDTDSTSSRLELSLAVIADFYKPNSHLLPRFLVIFIRWMS